MLLHFTILDAPFACSTVTRGVRDAAPYAHQSNIALLTIIYFSNSGYKKISRKNACHSVETAAGLLFVLQGSLDLFDHLSVFFLGQVFPAGVHGEGRAPLEGIVLVLGYQVEVQVAAAVSVGAVVDLVGMEGLMDGLGRGGNVLEERRPVLGGNVHQLADMVLVGHDDAAGMALLLEQDQLAHLQVADLDAEARQDLAAHAVTAFAVFHV